MKKLSLLLVLSILITLSSCQIVGDIFKTGVGVGVFLVIFVIGLVIFLLAKVFGAGK